VLIARIRKKFLEDFYRRDVNQFVYVLQQSQWDGMETHYRRQMNRLSEILHHSRSVPYYQKYLSGTDPASDPLSTLKKLPILEKESLLDNHDLLVHPWVKPTGKGTTSGSTGISLSFYFDENMLKNAESLTRFYRSWYGIELGDKTLRIWGRPLKGIKSRARSYVSDFLRGAKTLDPWNVSSINLENNWRQIVKFKPVYIYGYATSIAALAKWIEASGCGNSAKELGLKVVISTAETLLASDRRKVREVFQCPVVEEYGAAEVSIMAHECPQGGFHIANESLFLECVDDEGNDVQPGVAGHILVTSFVNRAQPLLRYRIGDYGTLLSEQCPCGRGMPLMKLTGAKLIEMIRTESGRIFSAEILDYVNLALMKDSSIGIRQFRVTQKDIHTFVVEVVPDEFFNEQSKERFSGLFSEQIKERNITISYDVKERISPLSSGKLLYFQSELP
jgi:phenylacetate-CoA ligase